MKIILLFLLPYLTLSLKTFYVSQKRTVSVNEPIGPFVAYIEFKDAQNETGWSMLTVKTASSFPDEQQANAAGLGEGYATAERILQYWINNWADYCSEPSELCDNVKGYIYSNCYWIRYMISKYADESPYWHHVNLIFKQIEGLHEGFNMVYPGRLSLDDFYLMNLSGHLDEIESALNTTENVRPKPGVRQGASCSALVKWLPQHDLLASQITWTTYQNMLRIVKNYIFNFKEGPKEHSIIPGYRQVFTSYPALIYSNDDYNLLGSGLLSMETTMGNFNNTLWKYVKTTESVPEFARSVLANRLARNGKEWAEVFKRFNCGTYNNQWMIIDYNKYTSGSKTLQNDTLWIIEQLPGFMESGDQTDVLRKQHYWPSYNTPFYPNIFQMGGFQDTVDEYGPMFAYSTCPRALIFKRDQQKVTDMMSLYKLMRYNDFKNDPLSRCPDLCNPPYSAENGIAARSDLNPANGTYALTMLGHRLHGATDYKGTNSELMKKLAFEAIAGPTSEQQPPFRWSTSDWPDTPHLGLKDLQLFPPISVSFEDTFQ